MTGPTPVPATPAGGPLAALEQAAAMLEQATTVDEAKAIRDKAEALRVYARQAGYSTRMANRCAALKLRAERRAGELLDVMAKAKNQHDGAGNTPLPAPRLKDVGVTKMQSSRWQKIATIPEPAFEGHIAERVDSEDDELTQAGMLRLAKIVRQQREPSDPPALPEGTYGAIVADPPWHYGNQATRGAATDHYSTLTVPQLVGDKPLPDGKNLAKEVQQRAADVGHLYLWTTNGFLREAFDVVEAWGYEYKTCLTWVKPQIGLGNYFRNSTEHVLFGVRGGLRTTEAGRSQRTDFTANRGRHSAKPDAFFDLVRRCSPGPYLEMFSRVRRLGWSNWGDEA